MFLIMPLYIWTQALLCDVADHDVGARYFNRGRRGIRSRRHYRGSWVSSCNIPLASIFFTDERHHLETTDRTSRKLKLLSKKAQRMTNLLVTWRDATKFISMMVTLEMGRWRWRLCIKEMRENMFEGQKGCAWVFLLVRSTTVKLRFLTVNVMSVILVYVYATSAASFTVCVRFFFLPSSCVAKHFHCPSYKNWKR